MWNLAQVNSITTNVTCRRHCETLVSVHGRNGTRLMGHGDPLLRDEDFIGQS